MATKGREDARFYLGSVKSPVAILSYGEIPDYLTEEFWSQYQIWNNSRLSGSLPSSPNWGENPEFIIDIITGFQNEYERIQR